MALHKEPKAATRYECCNIKGTFGGHDHPKWVRCPKCDEPTHREQGWLFYHYFYRTWETKKMEALKARCTANW